MNSQEAPLRSGVEVGPGPRREYPVDDARSIPDLTHGLGQVSPQLPTWLPSRPALGLLPHRVLIVAISLTDHCPFSKIRVPNTAPAFGFLEIEYGITCCLPRIELGRRDECDLGFGFCTRRQGGPGPSRFRVQVISIGTSASYRSTGHPCYSLRTAYMY